MYCHHQPAEGGQESSSSEEKRSERPAFIKSFEVKGEAATNFESSTPKDEKGPTPEIGAENSRSILEKRSQKQGPYQSEDGTAVVILREERNPRR
jgi:hypothetical protein